MGLNASNPIPRMEYVSMSEGDIFRNNYAEISFAEKFQTDLFQSTKQRFLPPDPEFVADVTMDPLIFTSSSTPQSAWQDVLIPLFNGAESTKTLFQQVLLEYCRFLQDRSVVGYQYEETRVQQRAERRATIMREVVRHHLYPQNEDIIHLPLPEANTLDNIVAAIGRMDLPDMVENIPIPRENIESYISIALTALDDNPTPNHIMNACCVALFAGDISILVSALARSIHLALNREKGTVSNAYFQKYTNMLYGFSPGNSIFLPSDESLLANIQMNHYTRKDWNQQFMASSGRAIFLATEENSILRVSLEQNISPSQTRYTKITTSFPIDGIVCANGYIVCISGKKVFARHVDVNEEWINPSIVGGHTFTLPFVTDGTHIYCIKKKKYSVFSIEKNTITFLRDTTFKFLHRERVNQDFPDFILKKDKVKPFFYTNGIVLSICIREYHTGSSFKFMTRHYSLIDGTHLKDQVYFTTFALAALQFDAYNNSIWGISFARIGSTLIRYNMDTCLPPSITGVNPLQIDSIDDFPKQIKKISNVMDISIFLDDFFTYYAAHLSGSKFSGCFTNKYYSVPVAHYFGPATPEFIHLVISAINSVILDIKSYKREGMWTTERLLNTLLTLIILLDYNLCNFETRVQEDNTVVTLSDTDYILDLLFGIYTDKLYQSIKKTAAFAIINSFSLLTKTNPQKGAQVFATIWQNSQLDFQQWTSNYLLEKPEFPYIMDKTTTRQVLSPIIKDVLRNEKGLQHQIQKDFLENYISSLLFAFRAALIAHPDKLPEKEQILQDNFQSLASVLVEYAIMAYSSGHQGDTQHFIRIFSKWLMLVKPFAKYSRIAIFMISILQPLFHTMCPSFTKISCDSFEVFESTWKTFLEVYSLYADFVQSLLEGGNELNEAHDYTWLVSSATASKLKPKHIDRIMQTCFSGLSDSKSLMKRGLSFRSIDPKSDTKLTDTADTFLFQLINKEEKPDAKLLMDLLYKKVPNPMNRKLSPEEKHIERVTLAVYIKQLGLSGLILEIVSQLKANNTQLPLVNHIIKQIMESIYKNRRSLRAVKQTTNTLKIQAEENHVPFEPKSLEENYPLYLENYLRKCVFLIHIEPANRFATIDTEIEFPKMKKNIDSFIQSTSTLEDFFNIMKAASKARANTSAGLALINDLFTRNTVLICLLNIIDRLASTSSISTFINSLENSDKKTIVNNEGFKYVQNIIETISTDIKSNNRLYQPNTLISFFLSLVYSLSKVTPDIVFDSLGNLIQNLYEQKGQMHPKILESYLTFIASNIYIVVDRDPKLKKSPQLEKLRNLLLPNGFTKDCPIPLTVMCYKAGMKLNISINDIIEMYKFGLPVNYHAISSLFARLLVEKPEPIKSLVSIFRIVSYITSGQPSFFFQKRPLVHQKEQFTSNEIRSPGIFLSGCAEFIQLIRFLLSERNSVGLLVEKVIKYILAINFPEELSSLIEQDLTKEEIESFAPFNQPRFIYAVFAILSNVIESSRRYSIIKDTKTNTIYYMQNIIPTENCYNVWKLPITKKSTLISLPFSPNLIPLSSIPFSYGLFPDYRYLIPHFIRALRGSNSSIPYNIEGTNFYILCSIREYLQLPGFIKDFTSKYGSIKIPKITYTSSIPMFRKVIRQHLANGGEGFYVQPPKNLEFQYASPSDVVHEGRYKITQNSLFCMNGIHAFLTQVLNETKKTFFTFRFNAYAQYSRIGLMTMTCEEGEADSFFLETDGKTVQVVAKESVILTNNSPSSTYMFQWDPNLKVSTLYSYPDLTPLQTMKFALPQVICWVQFFGSGSIIYQIGSSLPTTTNVGKPNYTSDFQVSPSVDIRRTIFRRKTTFISSTSNQDILNSIKKITIEPSTAFQGDVNLCSSSQHSMMLKITDHFAHSNEFPALIGYPAKALEKASRNLIISDFKKEDFPKNELNVQPIAFKTSINTTRNCQVHGAPLFSAIQPDSVIDTICHPKEAAVINDFTGIRTTISNYKEHFKPQDCVPVISPLYWGIIPNETLNFYSTGLTEHNRIEVMNEIFLSYITSPGSSVPDVMKVFNYDLKGLLHQFLSLLVFNEKIVVNCLIDYNINYLDPNTPPRDSSLHLYKSAMHKILDYIINNKLTSAFTQFWFKEVQNRFNDAHYHSVIDVHPSAVVVTSANLKVEDITIYRPDVTAWFVLKASLDINDEIIGEIYNEDKTKLIATISNQITIVRSNKFTLSAKNTKKNSSKAIILALPFNKLTNESMFGTFIDLAVSFKYLVQFISTNQSYIDQNKVQEYRTSLYTMFLDSIISHSPYFITYGELTLQYLESTLPSLSSDLVGAFLQRVNFIATYVDPPEDSVFGKWLTERQSLWRERIILPLKAHFQEFLTPGELTEVQGIQDPEFHIPTPLISWNISTSQQNISTIITEIRRLLNPRQGLTGFPFYHLLPFWGTSRMRAPAVETKLYDKNTLHVKFTSYIPPTFHFIFKGEPYQGSFTSSLKPDSTKVPCEKDIPTYKHSEFYIRMTKEWDSYEYEIESKDVTDLEEFMFTYKSEFVDDMKMLLTKWNVALDSALISCFNEDFFLHESIDLNFDPIIINNPRLTGISKSLLYTRGCILMVFNWLVANKLLDFSTDATLQPLNAYISPAVKIKSFSQIVSNAPTSGRPSISVNRKIAVDVREGISNNLKSTLMYQMADKYKQPSYRASGDRPWEVNFIGESGIDVGGPARELVTECAKDFMSPNCGLVVLTPNTINKVGQNRDVFLPYPNPNHTNVEKQYIFAGALIAICIRSGIVQEFQFPLFVWNYFITGKLSIEDIYSVDQNFKLLIDSIKEAVSSGMTEKEFNRQFNLHFVVYNLAGEEHSLTAKGRTEKVTLTNANQFIALAIEFKLREMEDPLKWMKNGLWGNLAISIPETLDASTLEFAACGDKDISYEALKDITVFWGIAPDQQDIFFRVIHKFTPEQRSALLKFATARVRLPPKSSSVQFALRVDNNGGQIDKLPTSSTCFHALHLPRYTSFEKAYNMISVAIEFTGTFENA